MTELVAGILLAVGAVYFVLLPILRPTPETPVADAGEDPEDDLSPAAVALRALREIEFDRATGKLSDADYDALKAEYTAQAATALREPGTGERGLVTGKSPARRQSPGPIPLSPSCPEHGPPAEPGAAFCSTCGRRLGQAPGYCARCGTALESAARYCSRCGSRVAA